MTTKIQFGRPTTNTHNKHQIAIRKGIRERRTQPSLKDLPCVGNIAQCLLHVNILEPKLVDARQCRHRAVPHIPRVIDIARAHLKLGIADVKRNTAMIDIQCALKHRTGTVNANAPSNERTDMNIIRL